METICGIHAVREGMESRQQTIEHIAIQRGLSNPRLQELIDLARARGISRRFEPKDALDRLARGAHHQGVVAVISGHAYAVLDDILEQLGEEAMLLLLDGVQDTHNLGALLRTACAAGADAVIVPERRAAGLTPAAVQAASGAVAYIPVVRVRNLAQPLASVKEARFWIFGLDERAAQRYDAADYRGRCAIVAGGEEKGLHELVKKKCDFLVNIPAPGKISTLNVSVATGIVLFEAARQRRNSHIGSKK